MGMILGFGREAILDHGHDLGIWWILDHDLGNRDKSMVMISNRHEFTAVIIVQKRAFL